MRTVVAVIGVGNRFRSDDGVGLAVAQRVRDVLPDARDLRIVESDGDPAELMDAWTGAGAAIVVDAMRSGAPAGSIRLFDVLEAPLPARAFAGSTHSFGLAHTVELARRLDRLPPRLTVLGIEGSRFAPGTALSASAEAALDAAVARVLDAVERLSGAPAARRLSDLRP